MMVKDLQLLLNLRNIFDVNWELGLIQPAPVEIVVLPCLLLLVVALNEGEGTEHH